MTKRFKRNQRVEIVSEHSFEATIVRYVSEMTRYGTSEHLPGWYETTGGTVHEDQLRAIS